MKQIRFKTRLMKISPNFIHRLTSMLSKRPNPGYRGDLIVQLSNCNSQSSGIIYYRSTSSIFRTLCESGIQLRFNLSTDFELLFMSETNYQTTMGLLICVVIQSEFSQIKLN